MKKYLLILVLVLASMPMWAQNYDLVVAKDGSGDFTTIQEAIMSVRDYKPEGRQRILVKKGVYEEKVIVPANKTNIALIGEDRDETILIWHDHANLPATQMPATKEGTMGTFQTYTLRVEGQGFECENMTIQNDAMTHYNPQWMKTRMDRANVGQAVAVHVEGDKVVFRHCRLLGFQDTLFTGNENSRQVYYDCYIEGTVDFIFGPATAWFDECHIHAIANGYITAASTPGHNPYGYVFYHCQVTADEAVNKEFLGRPWRPYASVSFIECELPACIASAGWDNWRNPDNEKTARFAEYNSQGKGANAERRAEWSKQLTREQASNLKLRHVLTRQDQWDANYRPTDFYALHFCFCDEFKDKGTRYVGGTLEPEELPRNLEHAQEELVMQFRGVDCTTFVEYMSAAMLGRIDNPSPTDSIMRRFVQALRYRQGKRGNYATRKHYFTEWIADNEAQGMLTEITAQMPGAKKQKKTLNFMTQNKKLYPQLAECPALVEQMKEVEQRLSQLETPYVPLSAIKQAYAQMEDGDIVAFVTRKGGLDVSHVGFVWIRDREYDEPRLLHASSQVGRVCISAQSLQQYATSLPGCMGIRIMRLNAK